MISNAAPNAINKGPVFRAGLAPSIVAGQTTLPSVRGTLTGWFKPMTVGVVEEKIAQGGDNDGQAVATVREVKTSGLLQPGSDEVLAIKPEGQRSWQTWTMHVYPQLDVKTDTRITIAGVPYRVMTRKDFVANGYIRYGLVEDYENA